MKNDKLDGNPQATAIVPSTETTAELILEPTARLVEKSFAENTLRNRRQALEKFDEWIRGRPITDGLLAPVYHKPENGFLSTEMAETRSNSLSLPQHW